MIAITRVVDSQQFILGSEVAALEEAIAEYSTVDFAVGCASGSDALLLALMAHEIGPGDEVLTTPYTFFATAGSIALAGATPVFADIDPETFNLDAWQAGEVLSKHPRIRAIIPVHLFGACADMDPLRDLAAGRSIPMIEDAAQAIGSEYKHRRAGSIGSIGCFSFFPTKNLGGYGEGGILTTNDAALNRRLRALRVHGSESKYHHQWIGLNSRLDALQAAVLRVKLRHLDRWTEARQRNAQTYIRLFQEHHVPIRVQQLKSYQTRHIYNQFVICTERRDQLQAHLRQAGIGTEIYYPIPLHLQRCFEHLGYGMGDFPVSEKLAAESLALPVFPGLLEDQIEFVAQTITRFFR